MLFEYLGTQTPSRSQILVTLVYASKNDIINTNVKYCATFGLKVTGKQKDLAGAYGHLKVCKEPVIGTFIIVFN